MNEELNFKKTLVQLKKFIAIPILTDRDKAGVIQAFEFTFEQCWKAIQKRAGNEGLQVGSPKKAFMFAFQNSWIEVTDEKLWINMLEDRNQTSHAYKEDVANLVLKRIIKDYAPAFERILARLESPL